MSNLSASIFVFENELNKNDGYREGQLLGELFQASITLGTNEGTVEVPTSLSEVIGLIDLSYLSSLSDPTDTIKLATDCVISSGAVTVGAKSVDIADGAVTVKGMLIGKRLATVQS